MGFEHQTFLSSGVVVTVACTRVRCWANPYQQLSVKEYDASKPEEVDGSDELDLLLRGALPQA